MDRLQKMVLEFHKTLGHLYKSKPVAEIDDAVTRLRIALIDEKTDELACAMYDGNLAEIADRLADLLYIVYGCALAYGIDLEPVFREVHKANMQKVGSPVSENGKIGEPSGWQGANITANLAMLSERSIG